MALPQKQTEVRDKGAKGFFAQIPHLVRLLPMHPHSKLLYWELKSIGELYAGNIEEQSRQLLGKAIAQRLRISVGMVSECKKELVAFQLITILTEGRRDIIELEDIWDRNRDHFKMRPDPMMDNPPTPSSYKTARKHVRKPKADPSKRAEDSPGETSNVVKIHQVKHEDSHSETSQTTETGSNKEKNVLVLGTREEEQPPSKTHPAPQPMPGNPVAAPNAKDPPRPSRKPNLNSAYPTTREQDPRIEDARILAFNEIFGREKLLSRAEIDEICERVRAEEQAQWADACRKWADSINQQTGRPYRVDLPESIGKLISFHLQNLRARPQTNASTDGSTNPASSTRPAYLSEPKGFAGIREWLEQEGLTNG